ncbi:CO3 protein, partial [Atractosteus spatula]|nr:CO3 protein [Atractosteus spatula]
SILMFDLTLSNISRFYLYIFSFISYVLTAPNVLRVSSEENIMVEAHDYSGGSLKVDILVLDFQRKGQQLHKSHVTLHAGNQFQALHKIKIPDNSFKKESSSNQYVILQARFEGEVLEKIVLVSFLSGYIFVQTDKSIYTPTDTVKVFCLLFCSFGTWKIVTKHEKTPQKEFTTDFEVKEYVLPSFEVKLEPQQPFFYIDGKELSVKITARFLYGSNVVGSAYVVFGVILDKDEKKSFPDSLQRVEIIDGKGTATLRREHITKIFPKIQELHKKSIYVSATVLTATGSDMVEAEKRGIQIVQSPYTIHFTKTPKYFKPGMPFNVMVLVTNPDGSPASKIPVKITPGETSGRTHDHGTAQMTINTQADATSLLISVKTNVSGLSQDRQATKKIVIQPYRTQNNSLNYLHIGVQKFENIMNINLNLGKDQGVQDQIKYFSYLIVNKGQIVRAGRQNRLSGQYLVTLSLPIEKEMIPSFRFLAYYYLRKGGQIEVVADSILVDGKSTCIGTVCHMRSVEKSLQNIINRHRTACTILVLGQIKSLNLSFDLCYCYYSYLFYFYPKLTVTPTTDRDRGVYEPRKSFSFTLTGDPGAKVGLVAVDKGVYVLNSKNRLSQSKIWNIVEKNDIGCTAGSGSDNMDVFYDAGLMFESNTQLSTKSRTDPKCPEPLQRRRRSLNLSEIRTTLASNYSGPLRKCCKDGMVENSMDYTCERRSQYIIESKECIAAFLHCCTEISKKHKERQEEMLILARKCTAERETAVTHSVPLIQGLSQYGVNVCKELICEEDNDFLGDDDIVIRTEFPESWLWQMEDLPIEPVNNDGLVTKDVQSFLKDSITTWEITAISLSPENGICVAEPYEITVLKDFFIDLKLPYSVVRNEQVEIKAVLYNYENVKRRVRVELMENEQICSAASKKRKHRVEVMVDPLSSRAVPFVIIPMHTGELDVEVKAAVFGLSLSDGVKKRLRVVAEGVKISKTIKTTLLNPAAHGGYQAERVENIYPKSIVPNTDAHVFITVTGEPLSETIESAISAEPLGKLIKQPKGCGEQNMIHMTPSFIATHYLDTSGKWEKLGLHRRSEAIKYINLGYTQQLAFRKTDGSFAAWKNRPSSTWLTAYVAKVFAMAYSLIDMNDSVLCGAIKWLILNKQQPNGIFKEDAPVYHGEMMGGVKGNDSDASLTAFVLIAMQESEEICNRQITSLQDSKGKAVRFLDKRIATLKNPYAVALTAYALSVERKNHIETLLKFASADKTHWPVPRSHLFTLEATAYALLSLLKYKDIDKSRATAKWLIEQRFYGGGYGSTQATIMVFQALAEYMIQASVLNEIDLDVEISLSGRRNPIKWRFDTNNAYVSRSEKGSINNNFTVIARGKGQGTLSIMALYNVLPEENGECKTFTLDVKIERVPVSMRPLGAQDTFKITIETKYLSDRDATMSILDITMLSGFIPDADDLKRLSNGVDQYIQKYEMDKALSDKGSLILYLDKVSHKIPDRIAFKVHKINEVGLMQPAAVTIYEYYANENHCVKFYHPEKETGTLNKICHGDVCKCAEDNCYILKQNDPDIDQNIRFEKACEAGMDYVYKAKLIDSSLTAVYDQYTMLIEDVIKEGTDEGVQGKRRQFVAPSNCRRSSSFEKSKTYLIMGKINDLMKTSNGWLYLLGGGTWLEWWPSDDECQKAQFQSTCENIKEVTLEIKAFGCPQ